MTRFEVIENETGKVDLDSSHIQYTIDLFTRCSMGATARSAAER